ncbi:uncharacterized protein LOC143032164 [Oratosquilla oratoria]|uniref:uncharacterized protein LOC143032164 n=1 Tax=Oratosquilla oratoria TaxID=337810 RepID=UPI003F76C93C
MPEKEYRLEILHLRCLWRILRIKWQAKVTNMAVLEKAGSLSMHLMLCQCRLRWFGHAHLMGDGCTFRDFLSGELVAGNRPTGRPVIRSKYVCKRNMMLTDIDPNSWKVAAADRSRWRRAVQESGKAREREIFSRRARDKRGNRGSRTRSPTSCPILCAALVIETAMLGSG